MRTTLLVASLLAVALLVPGPALAADEETTLRAVSRDTGVSVETLRTQKTDTNMSYGDLRMAHLFSQATRRSFEDVTAEFKSGKSWDAMAREVGLSLKEVVRIARAQRTSR